jgi:hypothetical protein
MSVGFKTVPLYGRRRFSFRGTARAQYYSLATAVKRLCIQLLGPLPRLDYPNCPSGSLLERSRNHFSIYFQYIDYTCESKYAAACAPTRDCPTKSLTALRQTGRLRTTRVFHLACDAPTHTLEAGRSYEDPPRQGDRDEQSGDALYQLPACSHLPSSLPAREPMLLALLGRSKNAYMELHGW